MMESKEISQTRRGLEAEARYFIFAFILSVLFVMVTWRWAAMVNPSLWTLWEDSRAEISRPITASIAHRRMDHVATLTPSDAQRQQRSKALLLRLFALGIDSPPRR
ncbi:MAG TPA: hypothetical protein VNF29_15030 [Candidatus Binataceae bacterium]|nr:hypothetical protein [Candidatus Binataceae bacterium]